MKKSIYREVEETDRHYRHFKEKVRQRLEQKIPVILVQNAHLPPPVNEVTIGDGGSLPTAQKDSATPVGQSQVTSATNLTVTSPSKEPSLSTAPLHMLDAHGVVTKDVTKCYMWTREVLGYGWWYTSEFVPQ
jgi:hypothetical protein